MVGLVGVVLLLVFGGCVGYALAQWAEKRRLERRASDLPRAELRAEPERELTEEEAWARQQPDWVLEMWAHHPVQATALNLGNPPGSEKRTLH